MLVLLYYLVCVDTCVVRYPIEYRIVVYLSDTASECVLQELPRAVDVGIAIRWYNTGTVKCHRSKLVTCSRW